MTRQEEREAEAKIYCERIAKLWEEISDNKWAASNWWESAGNPERAKQLRIEMAEEHLRKYSETGDFFDKWSAMRDFQEAGENERAKELIQELIAEFESGSHRDRVSDYRYKYELATLYKKLGNEERARQLFLEHAKEMEKKAASLRAEEKQKEADLAESWASTSYGAAGGEEYRQHLEKRVREIEEEDPDYPFLAFDYEKLGYREKAQRAYQKMAEIFEKEDKEYEEALARGDKEYNPFILGMSALYYLKAGNIEKAKEVLRRVAQIAENHRDKKGAMYYFARMRDKQEVKRLLQEILEEARRENDIPKLVDALIDMSWIDNNPALLGEAKDLSLRYAQEKEVSSDPEEKEEALHGYVEVVYILEGDPFSHLRYLWERHSVYNED